MKTSCLITLIAAFLLLWTNGMQAQTQAAPTQACLMNTEQFWLTSKYVEGETFLIQVSLPYDYATSGIPYPVLFFPDGDVAFGLIKGIVDFLMWGKNNRDIIVVGIGYGQGINAWATKRTHDLSPDRDTSAWARQFQDLGWADKFIQFIKDELFPVVNKTTGQFPTLAPLAEIHSADCSIRTFCALNRSYSMAILLSLPRWNGTTRAS